MATEQSNGFTRPFPALTAAHRCHFDGYDYVVIESVLTEDVSLNCWNRIARGVK